MSEERSRSTVVEVTLGVTDWIIKDVVDIGVHGTDVLYLYNADGQPLAVFNHWDAAHFVEDPNA